MTHEPKSPYVATLLSLLSPGLGHVYSGRIVPGLAFSGASLAVGMLGTMAVVAATPWAGTALLVAGAGWIGLWKIASVDAYRGARSRAAPPDPERPREYDRWYVYAVLAALNLASASSWAIAVRERVVQVFRVPSASMEPTVSKGAHVLVNELAYRTGPVKRGDIVVFVNPNERAQRYIKRVVALAGETVEMRGDDVFIDGAMLLHESGGSLSGGDPTITEANGGARYRVFPASSKDSLDSGVPKALAATRVPAGHCFVLGDDRRHSIDSRSVGPVPLADIVGRVDYVW